MNREKIFEKVKKIVTDNVDFDPEHIRLTEQTRLREDLGADSLDGIEIAMELDKEFGIDISDQEIDRINNGTLTDIVDVVEENLNKKQPNKADRQYYN